MDTIQKLVEEIHKQTIQKMEELILESLDFFEVAKEEIPNRVRLHYLEGGVKEIRIDNQLVLTFLPADYDFENNKALLKFKYKKHY